jgi:predicted secreted protein
MHINTGVAVAIYFILWWLSLLIVLPWGTHSQDESGDVAPGTEPGAPAINRVRSKLIWATVVATVLFAILWAAYASGLIPPDVIWAIDSPHR